MILSRRLRNKAKKGKDVSKTDRDGPKVKVVQRQYFQTASGVMYAYSDVGAVLWQSGFLNRRSCFADPAVGCFLFYSFFKYLWGNSPLQQRQRNSRKPLAESSKVDNRKEFCCPSVQINREGRFRFRFQVFWHYLSFFSPNRTGCFTNIVNNLGPRPGLSVTHCLD